MRPRMAVRLERTDSSTLLMGLPSRMLAMNALTLLMQPCLKVSSFSAPSQAFSPVSRMRAEEHESWTARTRRMFDDLHLVWIGLTAAVATIVCGAAALSLVHFASPEREDSLASMIQVISAPTGSDLNPVNFERFLQVPTVPESGAIEFMLAQPMTRDEVVLALNAVVTQDGRVSELSVLSPESHPREVNPILEMLSNARFEPGRMGASPVAVNLVWLLAHTTVRPKVPRTT